jgi:hypothetical protein
MIPQNNAQNILRLPINNVLIQRHTIPSANNTFNTINLTTMMTPTPSHLISRTRKNTLTPPTHPSNHLSYIRTLLSTLMTILSTQRILLRLHSSNYTPSILQTANHFLNATTIMFLPLRHLELSLLYLPVIACFGLANVSDQTPNQSALGVMTLPLYVKPGISTETRLKKADMPHIILLLDTLTILHLLL